MVKKHHQPGVLIEDNQLVFSTKLYDAYIGNADGEGVCDIFAIYMRTKKSKFDNFKKNGSFGLEMTREFHIRSQNSNRTALTPFLAKKRS